MAEIRYKGQIYSGAASFGSADDVSYDNTTSGLTATDVQGAVDEVANVRPCLWQLINTSNSSTTKTLINTTNGRKIDDFYILVGVVIRNYRVVGTAVCSPNIFMSNGIMITYVDSVGTQRWFEFTPNGTDKTSLYIQASTSDTVTFILSGLDNDNKY